MKIESEKGTNICGFFLISKINNIESLPNFF